MSFVERHLDTTSMFVYEHDKLHLVYKQDCQGVLDALKALPDMQSRHLMRKANLRHFASVPNVIAVSWATTHGVKLYSKEWLEVAKKELAGPNFSGLRVRY